MGIVIPVIILFILYFSVISLSKYGNKLYWFFESAHFIGGFFIAMFFSNFSFENGSTIVLVLLIGMLWEAGELVVNKDRRIQQFLINKFNYYIDRETTPGIILDLFLDFLGAITFLYLFNRLQ